MEKIDNRIEKINSSVIIIPTIAYLVKIKKIKLDYFVPNISKNGIGPAYHYAYSFISFSLDKTSNCTRKIS